MTILISGASGLIGSALTQSLESDGHRVLRLTRSEPSGRSSRELVSWQPEIGRFEIGEMEKLQGVEAVVHLAGESILGRWTKEKKLQIRESRVRSTQLLSEALAKLPVQPRVLISASATGFYGNRGGEILHEDSASGRGFLATVGREWESAADAARQAEIRTVHTRFGVVLTPHGGALTKMLIPFRLGLGGPIGSGRQFISWITMDDAVGALRFLLENETLEGAVNVVAPQPVTNRTFVQTLGKVLGRPAFLPLPAFALRLAFGKAAADETFLASQRAIPEKLQAAGYEFQHPQLEPALRHLLQDDSQQ